MLKNNRHSVRRICRSLVFVEEWISRSLVADLLIVMGQRTDSFHLIKACLGFCIEAGVCLPLIGEQGFRPFGGCLTAWKTEPICEFCQKVESVFQTGRRVSGLCCVSMLEVSGTPFAKDAFRLAASSLILPMRRISVPGTILFQRDTRLASSTLPNTMTKS